MFGVKKGGIVPEPVFVDGIKIHPVNSYDLAMLYRELDETREVVLANSTSIGNLKKLTGRIAVLECAEKGHGPTKTVREEGARITRHGNVVDIPGGMLKDISPPDNAEWGTRIVTTCRQCGAELSDDWEPKEATDDPEA